VICVYAIATRPRRAIRARGIGGARLEAIPAGRLAAIVGGVARSPTVTPAHLKAYDAAITALSRELPALLPVRFGTCVAAADDIALLLRSGERSFRDALAAVRGRVQMTLRIADTGLADDAAPAPAPAPAPASGAAYLRQRAAKAARERHVPGFEPVRQAVQQWVRDERVERRPGVVAVYHLIPAGSVRRYVRAVTRSAQAAGVRVRLTGPFPPYAFAAW
jgi:hypothetical protein